MALPPGMVPPVAIALRPSGSARQQRRNMLPQQFVLVAGPPDAIQTFGIITIERVGIINDDASPDLFAALSQQRLRPEEAVAVCISRVLSLVPPRKLQEGDFVRYGRGFVGALSQSGTALFAQCVDASSLQGPFARLRFLRVGSAVANRLAVQRSGVLKRTFCRAAGVAVPSQSLVAPEASAPASAGDTVSYEVGVQQWPIVSSNFMKRTGGLLSYTFTFRCIATALKLFSVLRSSWTALREVVLLACQLSLSPQCYRQVQLAIEDGTLRVPSRAVMLRSRMKMDILDMLWQRRQNHKRKFIRHLSVDASPQLRHNFLCVRERRIDITSEVGAAIGGLGCQQSIEIVGVCLARSPFKPGGRPSRLQRRRHQATSPRSLDPSHQTYKVAHGGVGCVYESRSLPATCLGRGKATLIHKVHNATHSQMLECGSSELFDKVRHEVRSITSDTGVERMLADAPYLRDPLALGSVLQRLSEGAEFSESTEGFLYPACLFIPGHLHLVYNSLQAAVEKEPAWGEMLRLLRGVNSFLKDLSLRQRCRMTCFRNAPPPHSNVLATYKSSDLDWKWEFLTRLLEQVVEIMPVLQLYWDLPTMLKGASITAACLQVTDSALRSPGFLAKARILLKFSKAVDLAIGKIEGCPCHQEVWRKRKRWADRQSDFAASTGTATCPWKGCWGAHMALGMGDELVRSIVEAADPEVPPCLWPAG